MDRCSHRSTGRRRPLKWPCRREACSVRIVNIVQQEQPLFRADAPSQGAVWASPQMFEGWPCSPTVSVGESGL